MIKVGKIWIWNEYKTSVPAVPQSRREKNEYEMSIELVLPQSRTPAVEKKMNIEISKAVFKC